MKDNYSKVFSGNAIKGKKIELELNDIGILPVIKNEGESARLAGFASSMLGSIDIYVNNDEKEKAMKVVNKIENEK